jgi:hypothetical protein
MEHFEQVSAAPPHHEDVIDRPPDGTDPVADVLEDLWK